MIATDRFVFIHLHKSGGSFVNEFLMRCFPGALMLGYHLPRSLIPAELSGLPVLGFVRSPWSYYVSWYAFQLQMAQPNALFQFVSDNRRLDFSGTLHTLMELGSNDRLLDRLLDVLPHEYSNRGLNLPRFVVESIRGSGLGFYSWLYGHLYSGGANPSRIGRLENLRTDLLELLAGVSHPLTAEQKQFIDTAAPRNASSHEHWRSYYDEETAALVARHDHSIIQPHGYRFDA